MDIATCEPQTSSVWEIAQNRLTLIPGVTTSKLLNIVVDTQPKMTDAFLYLPWLCAILRRSSGAASAQMEAILINPSPLLERV